MGGGGVVNRRPKIDTEKEMFKLILTDLDDKNKGLGWGFDKKKKYRVGRKGKGTYITPKKEWNIWVLTKYIHVYGEGRYAINGVVGCN